MSYKVKILRQTDFVSAHREHIAIFTLCNCYRCSCTETFLDALQSAAKKEELTAASPADVKSWTTFFTNKFEKKQKNKPYKAFSRYRTALSLVGLNCYSI